MLYTENGDCVEDKNLLRDHILAFYKGMLGTKKPVTALDLLVLERGPLVSQAAGTKLLQPISSKEVKQALWSITANKSPGPDGFSSGFYKKAWPVVGESICLAVKEFFTSGKLLKQLNATALVLLPKSENPQTIKEYRP